jgi:hypothetical protein
MKPIFPFLAIREFLVLHLEVHYLTCDSAPSEDGRHPLAGNLLTLGHLVAAFKKWMVDLHRRQGNNSKLSSVVQHPSSSLGSGCSYCVSSGHYIQAPYLNPFLSASASSHLLLTASCLELDRQGREIV